MARWLMRVERAIAMAMMEQYAEATALLDEALTLDPKCKRAHEWKEQLRVRRR